MICKTKTLVFHEGKPAERRGRKAYGPWNKIEAAGLLNMFIHVIRQLLFLSGRPWFSGARKFFETIEFSLTKGDNLN